MRRDSIGIKLGVAFGFLIAILMGVAWLGLRQMGQVKADWDQILNQGLTKLDMAHQAVMYVNSNYRMTISLVLMEHKEPSDVAWYPPRRDENREKVDSAKKKIREVASSEEERKLLDEIDEASIPARNDVSKLVDLLSRPGKPGGPKARAVMEQETIPTLNRYRESWLAFIRYEEAEVDRAKKQSEANYASTIRLSVSLILLAIGVAIGIAVFATRGLSRHIQQRDATKLAIRRLNEDLEKKVAERTEDLGRTVEALKEEAIERRAREEDYRRLAAIVECSDDAVIGATLDGIVTDWNAGAERMFGYARNEMIGKPIAQIIPTERRHEFLEGKAKLLKGESVVRLESVRLRKDGKPFHVAIAISPIIDSDGRIMGGAGILRDITERKFMEDALRRSEASYRSFVENAPFGILRTTLDGQIVQANPALVEMLGYDSEEEVLRLRMSTDVYLHPEEREEATLWCRKQDAVQGIEVEWKHKSGRPFTIRCAAHVVKDNEGGVEFLEGFVEDISERRAMEQQLRQAQKMEAVGRLAGGIAHDFNNLLGVIIGYGDLALEQANPSSPLHQSVEQVRKAAGKASTLTRQLLAFSRQQVLEVKVLDLNMVVAEMGKMLPRLLGEDIHLEIVLCPVLGRVKADQGQIEQVIMNLAVNARDAMPEGGRLLIQTGNASARDATVLKRPPMAPGEYVMMSVTDTGMGMDPQTQAHIFEPFFTTKEVGKGTGLGLATVYGFMKQSGGYVFVDSEPGAGSTFTIYLPKVQEETKAPAPAEAAPSRRAAETILLVEDEESLRTLTRNLLVDGGYKVLEVSDGNEAIEVARTYEGPIHLLLTDMVMPGMNGQTVAEKLIALRPGTRVVYMSGYTGFSAEGLADLNAMVIPKPFTRGILLNKLREALNLEEKTNPA
jgi:two-component system cell cycle sensor histidine kinase/response regulator CckA